MREREWKTDDQGRQIEWEGGYIRYDKKHRPTWYIEKMRDGIRYLFTAATNERKAYVELDRFLRDPGGYQFTAAESAQKPLFLTAALRQEYIDYCERPKSKQGAENEPLWVRRKTKIMKWWQTKLVDQRGRLLNLRRVPRDFVPTVLDGKRDERNPGQYEIEPSTDARTKRIIIKDFYAWLRVTKRLLTPGEDPVIDLPVGEGNSSITDKDVPKDRVPPEHVKAVIELGEKQGSLYAHVLRVQAGTGGWHTTEMLRFVTGGSIEPFGPDELAEGCAAKLVCPKHKRGGEFRAKVTQSVLDSARIILNKVDRPEVCAIPGCKESHSARHLCRKHYQAWQSGGLTQAGDAGKEVGHNGFHRGKGKVRGSFSRRHYENWVHECCDELGIPRFSPSWMRHTNATYAKNQGKTSAQVGARIGHAPGSNMVDKFYAPRTAPPKMPTILDKPEVKTTPPNVRKLKRAPQALDHAEVVSKIEDLLAQLKQGETG